MEWRNITLRPATPEDEANVPVTLSVLNGNRAITLYQRVGFKVVDSADGAVKMKRSRKDRL
ncbi:hypothetical protein SOV92_07455 [Pectobacterium brasiliense]|uniref:Acetyltransferase n=1 Tax=Pectobacterium brasiliense TaxID=180957 RepID=A0AAW9H995_9GAMM|nr:hypothetical protein [Pectobacterium brasiliense]MDY4377668.1 hypothetical protein [Pectobacterium brasiliense]